jgi:hypothetical protein
MTNLRFTITRTKRVEEIAAESCLHAVLKSLVKNFHTNDCFDIVKLEDENRQEYSVDSIPQVLGVLLHQEEL